MSRKIVIATIICAASTYAACGGGDSQPAASPSATTPPPSSASAAGGGSAQANPPPPPKKKTAKEVVEEGGTFMFSLADSADAKKHWTEDCEKKAKKDQKKLDACMKDIDAAAAEEGIRIEKGDKGLVYVSFGKEKGKEVTYIKMGFKIAKEDGQKIAVTPEGKPEGKLKPPKEMAFEVVDETTLALDSGDPKKGRLVYKKK